MMVAGHERCKASALVVGTGVERNSVALLVLRKFIIFGLFLPYALSQANMAHAEEAVAGDASNRQHLEKEKQARGEDVRDPATAFFDVFIHNDLATAGKALPVLRLNIPRPYVAKNRSQSNNVWSTTVLTKYVDGTLAMPPSEQRPYECGLECIDRIEIIISNRIGISDYYSIENQVMRGIINDTSHQDEFGIGVATEKRTDGLMVYKKRYVSNPNSVISEDFYVGRGNDGSISFVSMCRPVAVNPLCEGYSTLPGSGGVTVTYHFSASFMGSWKNLQNSIHSLVGKWIADVEMRDVIQKNLEH